MLTWHPLIVRFNMDDMTIYDFEVAEMTSLRVKWCHEILNLTAQHELTLLQGVPWLVLYNALYRSTYIRRE